MTKQRYHIALLWFGLVVALWGGTGSTYAWAQREPGQSYVIDSLRKAYDTLDGEAYWNAINDAEWEFVYIGHPETETLIDYLDVALDSAKHPRIWAYHQYVKGIYFDDKGEKVTALLAYFIYLESAAALDMEYDIGNAYNTIAGLYEELGMHVTALSYYKEGLDNTDSVKDFANYGFLLNNTGEIFFNRKDYDSALHYYQRAYDLLKDEDDAYKVAPLHNIGRTQGILGQYLQALEKLQASYNLDKKSGDLEGMALDNLEIGKLYFRMNRYDSAEFHLRNAYHQGQRVHSQDVLEEVTRELGNLFASMDDYASALRYQTAYREYTDSLYESQQFLEVQAVEQAHQVREQAQEINRLRRASSLEEIRLRNTTLQVLSFVVTFILVLVVLGVILWQYRTNAKASTMLNQSNRQLEESNEALISLNERLAASESSLQEVNATKDKFFSIISHDLKSPLNSLMGLLNILLKYGSAISNDERKDLTKKIDGSVKALTNLLDNLLKWSMAQTDTIDYLPRVLDVRQEVTRIVKLVALNAEQKSIKIEQDIANGTLIFADADMINFILRNLITNSVKFTYPGGKIKIVGKTVGKKVQVYVMDNGMGIPKDNLKRLFRIDTTVSTKGTNNETGTGLGLLLIKEFVEKNKGKIEVDSAEGKGTRFLLTFPSLDMGKEPM